MAKNEWIEDQKKRAKFWATAEDLGLSENQARLALGLGPDKPGGRYKSTLEYTGTLTDALNALDIYVASIKRAEAEAEAAVEEALDEEKIEQQVKEDFGEEIELTEPGCVLFSQALMTSKKGLHWEINFTLRGADFPDAFGQFVAAVAQIEKWQGLPLLNTRYQEAATTMRDPDAGSRRETSAPSPSPSSPPSQPGTWPGYTGIKTGALSAVEVRPDGQVWTHVVGAQYPLQDRRGIEAVAPAFEGYWSIGHLGQGYYAPPQGVNLTVVYGKNDRGFWDLLEVRSRDD